MPIGISFLEGIFPAALPGFFSRVATGKDIQPMAGGFRIRLRGGREYPLFDLLKWTVKARYRIFTTSAKHD
jgi:hypothetical protein